MTFSPHWRASFTLLSLFLLAACSTRRANTERESLEKGCLPGVSSSFPDRNPQDFIRDHRNQGRICSNQEADSNLDFLAPIQGDLQPFTGAQQLDHLWDLPLSYACFPFFVRGCVSWNCWGWFCRLGEAAMQTPLAQGATSKQPPLMTSVAMLSHRLRVL